MKKHCATLLSGKETILEQTFELQAPGSVSSAHVFISEREAPESRGEESKKRWPYYMRALLWLISVKFVGIRANGYLYHSKDNDELLKVCTAIFGTTNILVNSGVCI